MTGVRRHLGLVEAVAIYVGIILGSGIFVAPASVAASVGSLPRAILLWSAGAVVALSGAACYAECAARLPENGGFFVFHGRAYGPAVAFVGGWAALFVTYPASVGAIGLVLAKYLNDATGHAWDMRVTAAAAIAVAGGINLVGVRTGPRAQVVLTTVKVGALAVLLVAALRAAPGEAPAAPPAAAGGLGAALTALVIVLWSYEGWSDVTLVAGEVVEPGRNIGRAVVFGTATLFGVYALAQIAFHVLPPAMLAGDTVPSLTGGIEGVLGPVAGRGVAVLVVVSTFGSIVGVILTVSRLAHAMAESGAFLPWFGAIHPALGTPARAIAAMTLASVAYVAAGSFGAIVDSFTFSVWIFYGLTAVAVLRLRARRVGEPPAWRAPCGALAPAVVLLTGACMTTSLVARDPRHAAIGATILAAAVPVYLAVSARGASRRSR